MDDTGRIDLAAFSEGDEPPISASGGNQIGGEIGRKGAISA
jgi:hypothetical protein